MKIAILDYNDGRGIKKLWIRLTDLMEPDDGPTLDSSDNKFSNIYIELNSRLHEKIFLPTGSDNVQIKRRKI